MSDAGAVLSKKLLEHKQDPLFLSQLSSHPRGCDSVTVSVPGDVSG